MVAALVLSDTVEFTSVAVPALSIPPPLVYWPEVALLETVEFTSETVPLFSIPAPLPVEELPDTVEPLSVTTVCGSSQIPPPGPPTLFDTTELLRAKGAGGPVQRPKCGKPGLAPQL